MSAAESANPRSNDNNATGKASNNDKSNAKTAAEAYHHANVLCQQVKNSALPSSSSEQHVLVKKAAQAVLEVLKMVDILGLFSENEDLKDISSVNLKYLMCDFMAGDLFMNLYEQKIREQCIKQGKTFLKKFLDRCEDLELMSEMDLRLFHNNGKSSSILSTRSDKIARSKNNRKMKSELEELLKMEKRKVEKQGVQDEDTMEEDENERKKWTIMLKLAISEALDHLRFADDELKMLEFQRNRPNKSEGHRPPKKLPGSNGNSIIHIKSAQEFMRENGVLPGRRESPGGAVDIGGKMQRLNLAPASHTTGIATAYSGRPDARTQVLSEMFVPRNLPTMSIDELLEIERKQGKIPPKEVMARKKKHDHKEEEDQKEEEDVSDNDDDEAHNARQKKRREWDNYKDDNEKGAGNRLGNPRGRNFI
mmetsp:Transcript_29495/g.71870  ORF Transcript_29495/g.71870 Transcript_29495/m.71870 type:complete len:422 (-) Transcript_29495:168-1433(-)